MVSFYQIELKIQHFVCLCAFVTFLFFVKVCESNKIDSVYKEIFLSTAVLKVWNPLNITSTISSLLSVNHIIDRQPKKKNNLISYNEIKKNSSIDIFFKQSIIKIKGDFQMSFF